MRDVRLKQEPVALYKILKFEGLLDSGGAAKDAIARGMVRVNGETETRKRRKISGGDLIEVGDEKIRTVYNPEGE